MPDLGRKYTCYSCHTKFYDLGKPVPLCPKCGADQRDAEDTPVVTSTRGRQRIVEEPIPDDEFAAEGEAAAPVSDEDEEIVPEPEREEEVVEDEEEEEEF